MMKKILLLSVLFLSIASVSMAALGKEKDKKQKPQTTIKPLLTPQDSLSYAAGLAATNGLMPFCLLYTSPSPRDRTRSRMPSSA